MVTYTLKHVTDFLWIVIFHKQKTASTSSTRLPVFCAPPAFSPIANTWFKPGHESSSTIPRNVTPNTSTYHVLRLSVSSVSFFRTRFWSVPPGASPWSSYCPVSVTPSVWATCGASLICATATEAVSFLFFIFLELLRVDVWCGNVNSGLLCPSAKI